MSGLTSDQVKASDPLRTAFVAASAGTGKTHVLIARLVRLMLSGTPPAELLCLTFTKAAAAEMKTRLYGELSQWTSLSDRDLTNRLSTRFALTADGDMLKRARRLFTETLDLSDELRIQTFHSFCQSILGRFPLEAGLLPGFRAAEDAEAKAAMAEARDEALNTSLTSEAFASYIRLIADRTTEGTFGDLMHDLRGEQAILDLGFQHHRSVGAYLNALDTALGIAGMDREALLVEAFSSFPIPQHLMQHLHDVMNGGTKTDQTNAQHLARYIDLHENGANEAKYAALSNWLLTKEGLLAKRLITKAALKLDPAVEPLIDDLAVWMDALRDKLARRLLSDQSAALIVIGYLQLEAYGRVKQQEGLVDFADMVDRTVNLLSDQQSTDWILFKLDQEISHILVDEAQDTNADQWRVVDAIAAEFFAGKGVDKSNKDEDGETVRTVFAVGDEKQSIFSFQGAEPDKFVSERSKLSRRATEAGLIASTIPMNQSFRSGRAVLSLVDAVFSDGDEAGAGVLFGQEMLQHDTARKGAAGSVEIWPLEQEEERSAEDPWSLPVEQTIGNRAEDRLAGRIATHIYHTLNDKRLLESRGRPIRPGDIMVLVRRRKGFVDQLTRALETYGIAVAGRDRMTLTDELAVMDLMALARSALLPDDDLTLATVLKGPFIGLTEDQLFTLAHDRGNQSLFQRLAALADKDDTFKPAHTRYQTLIRDAERLDCAPYFASILEEHRGRAALLAQLGEDAADPINAFLERADQFDRQERGSLLGFLKHMEKAGSELKRDLEGAGNAVRIMTAHASKGLQAPIVYLADTTSLPDTSRDKRLIAWPQPAGGPPLLLWSSDIKGLEFLDTLKKRRDSQAIEEYNRLLYVALTRAEDHLFITGVEGYRTPSDKCWYAAINRAFDRLDGVENLSGDRRHYHIPQSDPVSAATGDDDAAPPALPPEWLALKPGPDPEPQRPLRPSQMRPAPAKATLTSLFSEAEKRDKGGPDPMALGVIMHQAFEWLAGVPGESRRDQAVRFFETRLGTDSVDARTNQVMAVFDHPDLADLMGGKGRSEVGLSGRIDLKDGPTNVTGRIDRLLVTDREIVFADFKTGERVAKTASDVPPETLYQMALYGKVLRKIYPDRPLRAVLIYTENATVVDLTDGDLKAALPLMQGG